MKIEVEFEIMKQFELKFGKELQIIKASEEMSELNILLMKYINKYNNYNKFNINNIEEEISDVILMMFQLIAIFSLTDFNIQRIIEFKIKRTMEFK